MSYRLIETIVDYSEEFEIYKDNFPQEITVGQVVATWKEVATFQKTVLK